jgi:hypothetical protein
MKIGYLIADFPVLSETFVVNDIKGLEALGHEVVAVSLGKADPATEGNPNYQIAGRTIRVKGLTGNSLVRKATKLRSRFALMRRRGASFRITCFALLFSFVGTILGGIWADQSWGRFWGWDPKENGAVLIVLANAIFLHARWGGLVKERGMANIAIFGNIVTAWSYFGTNMLGVGLHSYGFMSSAAMWLTLFIGSQLFFIGCGLLPQDMWRSSGALAAPPEAQEKSSKPKLVKV